MTVEEIRRKFPGASIHVFDAEGREHKGEGCRWKKARSFVWRCYEGVDDEGGEYEHEHLFINLGEEV